MDTGPTQKNLYRTPDGPIGSQSGTGFFLDRKGLRKSYYVDMTLEIFGIIAMSIEVLLNF